MEKILFAVQKSGRLNEDSVGLLKECGISIDTSKEQLKIPSSNYPLEVLYLRNADIPEYVQDGVADIGILGENVVVESEANIEILKKLNFSKCRLSMAIPKNVEYIGLQYFQGKKIATSYPNTTKVFLKKNNIQADIHVITGSVEIAPNIGLADGICDLVSSGSTLFLNGLKEVEVILKSEAVLVCNKKLSPEKRKMVEEICFRIETVLTARKKKYVLLNVPDENLQLIIELLHGITSPTVMKLARQDWSSLHAVIEEQEFWNIVGQLKKLGAEGILVLDIEKMVS